MRLLDAENYGIINILELDDFAGPDGLQMTLEAFVSNQSTLPIVGNSIVALPQSASRLELEMTPLLVWVDDCPENNVEYSIWASTLGVHVVQLLSTQEAKDWIEENLGNYPSPKVLNLSSITTGTTSEWFS